MTVTTVDTDLDARTLTLVAEQQVLDMGQAEGMKQAMGQMDAILAE